MRVLVAFKGWYDIFDVIIRYRKSWIVGMVLEGQCLSRGTSVCIDSKEGYDISLRGQ